MAGFQDVLDPSFNARQQDITQQQQLAQMLLQQGMTPEQGQMVSGHYIAPAFGGLGRLANVWAAQHMRQKNMSDQTALDTSHGKIMGDALSNLFGGGQPQQPAQQPQQAPQNLTDGAISSATGSPSQVQQMPQQAPQQPIGGMGGDPRSMAAIASLFPGAMDSIISNRFTTPDAVKTMDLTGQNRQLAGLLATAKAAKEGRMEAQPGNTIIDPLTLKPLYTAPDFKTGTQGGFDAQGRPTMGAIPGNGVLAQLAGQQATAVAGNTASAQAPYKFSDIVQPDGTTLKVSDAQIRAATSKGGMPIQSAGQHAAEVAKGSASGATLAKAQSDLPVIIANADEAIKQIDEMVGSEDNKTPPHAGFNDYVGATWKPGMRFVEGSPEASFQAREEQIKGGVFLKAYQDLKGGGQITEIEGAKAESALNRMKKSISKPEYITAARDYQDALRKGVQRAREQAQLDQMPEHDHIPAPTSNGWSIKKVN